MAREFFDVIVYRNDNLNPNIQKALVLKDNRKYSFFRKVIDYPLNKNNLNRRLIWLHNEEKKGVTELNKSGDWCTIKSLYLAENFLK